MITRPPAERTPSPCASERAAGSRRTNMRNNAFGEIKTALASRPWECIRVGRSSINVFLVGNTRTKDSFFNNCLSHPTKKKHVRNVTSGPMKLFTLRQTPTSNEIQGAGLVHHLRSSKRVPPQHLPSLFNCSVRTCTLELPRPDEHISY